ncbi:RING finger protein ETP1 homolog [Arachis hypogaea]|uniref:RING finger protein ETP1 homolog n=2 Tax=Arachis TaxID=3817 RepID=UPI003B21AAB0
MGFFICAQKGKGMQFQRSGILTTLCDHSFQCPCVSKWTYLSCPILDEYNCLLTSQLETQRQNILHDSDDEECLKILKNCWKAIHRMMGWTKFFLQCQSRQMLLRWLSGLMFS